MDIGDPEEAEAYASARRMQAEADAVWQELQQMQLRRQALAEEATRTAAQEQSKARPTLWAPTAAAGSSSVLPSGPRDEDEPDQDGWTPRMQRALEAALRAHPPTIERKARWEAIAAAVGSKSARDCVRRCRAVAAAVRGALPPPLLRLQPELLLSTLERVGGRDLCALAATCKELGPAAHDDALWLPIADALPAKWAYSRNRMNGEAPWSYALRVRHGLYGSWQMLTDHRAGRCPYLAEVGMLERGRFVPHDGGTLPYRLKYGFICELVQLEAEEEGGLNHRVYKAVADKLVALSSNSKSRVPTELHMTVREIYKTCYPGYGAATGSGAYAPGLQAGGSSAKGATCGSMIGKGTAAMTKKVQDEEMRKRLDTCHEFLALVR